MAIYLLFVLYVPYWIKIWEDFDTELGMWQIEVVRIYWLCNSPFGAVMFVLLGLLLIGAVAWRIWEQRQHSRSRTQPTDSSVQSSHVAADAGQALPTNENLTDTLLRYRDQRNYSLIAGSVLLLFATLGTLFLAGGLLLLAIAVICHINFADARSRAELDQLADRLNRIESRTANHQ